MMAVAVVAVPVTHCTGRALGRGEVANRAWPMLRTRGELPLAVVPFTRRRPSISARNRNLLLAEYLLNLRVEPFNVWRPDPTIVPILVTMKTK